MSLNGVRPDVSSYDAFARKHNFDLRSCSDANKNILANKFAEYCDRHNMSNPEKESFAKKFNKNTAKFKFAVKLRCADKKAQRNALLEFYNYLTTQDKSVQLEKYTDFITSYMKNSTRKTVDYLLNPKSKFIDAINLVKENSRDYINLAKTLIKN